MKQIFKFAETRKFWTAVAGGVVTYITIAYNSPEWLNAVTLALTAFGVYGVSNTNGKGE